MKDIQALIENTPFSPEQKKDLAVFYDSLSPELKVIFTDILKAPSAEEREKIRERITDFMAEKVEKMEGLVKDIKKKVLKAEEKEEGEKEKKAEEELLKHLDTL
jgi:DNA invertase Pin-like site-specific DNA recombinase